MIELVVAGAALAGAAGLLAAALPPRGILAWLVATGLLFQALVLASMAIAGLLLRTLRPEILTVIAIAWLALAVTVAWRRGITASTIWASVARAITRLGDVIREPAVALAGLLVVGTLIWRAFLVLRLPMVDYDGWSYHLVFGDVWIQQQALTLVPQRIWTAGFPGNSEVLTAWLMAFSHSDAFAGFGSIIPMPLGMAAVAGLARGFGAARRPAVLAGLLFGMTPALVALAGTSYVDASSVAFAVATWYLGVRVLRGGEPWSTVALLGLAGGLAIGTKGTNAPLTAPILGAVGILLLVRLVRSGSRFGRRDAIIRLAALSLPVLLYGGIWYIKNALAWGNPMYPFAIGPFAGPTTLATFSFEVPQLEHLPRIRQIAESWAWDWKLSRYVYNLRPGGIGRAWFLVLPFAFIGVGWLLRRRQWAALAFVVVVAGATLAVMPMPWYARETLFVPAVGLALAAVSLSAFPRPLATIGGLLVVFLAAISLVFVNIKPNVQVTAPNSTHLASPTQYVRYLLSSDDRRADVSLRHECAAFDQIPVGARVAPGGFNLLHGVAGPNLDRILTDPLPDVADAAGLAAAMEARQATWVVTSSGAGLDLIAASDASRFEDHGDICQGAHLWRLVTAGG
jgi:hypothetical protein